MRDDGVTGVILLFLARARVNDVLFDVLFICMRGAGSFYDEAASTGSHIKMDSFLQTKHAPGGARTRRMQLTHSLKAPGFNPCLRL